MGQASSVGLLNPVLVKSKACSIEGITWISSVCCCGHLTAFAFFILSAVKASFSVGSLDMLGCLKNRQEM